jgi:alkanesulfonate monooxygenase SsuD/methylene tetrahydromethanopterin reductase-like flavin-dependent oxidoreductase (luciferase family)
MSLRLGYNISTLDSDTPPIDLFNRIADQARAAERAGFDLVTVSDHLYQPPFAGAPDGPTLEAYTTLAALAASTNSIRLW